jgi:putative transposase
MKGDFFHILNRGVEKRNIFLNKEDYLRFAYNLYDFNDQNDTVMPFNKRHNPKDWSAMRWPTNQWPTNKKKLVDVLCWCLMSNHYHILVQEKIDGGASIFSKKISGGYTQYFNLKNERSGVLFQGRSKIIPIKQEDHFIYLPYYIFSNPVKLIERNWKEDGIKNIKKVEKFLEDYTWSSYLNILGKNDLIFIINKELFNKLFLPSQESFKKHFSNWLVGHAMANQDGQLGISN